MARKLERLDAKKLYCEEGIEIPEIAKRLNVPEKTVYRWKIEDKERGSDWDKEREMLRMTSFSAYKQMLKLTIDKLTEAVATKQISAKDADAITKMIKAVKSLYRDVDMQGNVLLAISELSDFLQQKNPDLLEKLVPYLIEFGNEISRKYGKKVRS